MYICFKVIPKTKLIQMVINYPQIAQIKALLTLIFLLTISLYTAPVANAQIRCPDPNVLCADAGPDQTVRVGTVVRLDPSGSSGHTPSENRWRKVSGPRIRPSSTGKLDFIALFSGIVVYQLTVVNRNLPLPLKKIKTDRVFITVIGNTTGLPVISGTPTQGQTLTAVTDGITDADGLGTGGFSYQWQAGDYRVSINGATGTTFKLTQAQVGQPIRVVVSYTDGGNNPESLTSAPTNAVTNTNDAPTGLPTITGTPTQGATLTAGTDDIRDADGVGSFSYQWQGNDNDIDSATSDTFILTQAQVGQTITVKVSYTDQQGTAESLTSAATNAVTNTNDAPTITGTTTFTIAENASDGAMVGTITGADVDAGTTLTYSITAGNTNDAFTIDSASGDITVHGDNKLDHETTPSYSLMVTVSDSSLEATATVTINVEDVNEAPTITGTPPDMVAEDDACSFTPGGGDVDANDTPVYSLSNHPNWLLVDTATGALSGTPTNADVGTHSDIVLTITSGGQTDTLTFSIEVTNTNDAPTITGTPPTTIAEDDAYTFTPEGGDVDAGDTPVYSLSDNPTWLMVNDATGELSGTPTNADVGTHSDIVLTITSGGETAALTFSIEVTNTNDAPTITGTPPDMVAEDSAYTFTPEGGDVDGDTLTYSINTQPSWADFSTTTGALSGTPTNDDIGITEDIVISVSDGIAEAVSLPTFSITVTNTNDAPTITGTPPASIAQDSAYSFTPGGGDVDANDTPSYTLSNNPDWLLVDTATGTLSGTPRNNDVGTTTSIVLTITSGGQTDTLTFSIEVTNTNDAPTGLPTISGTATQGATLTAVTSAISDADGLGSFSYQWQADTVDVSGATDTSLELTQAEVGKTITVKVSYTDGGSTTETLTSVPTNVVTDVNDAPTITGATTFTIAENAGDGAMVGTIIGADVDAGTTLAYSIIAGNTNDAFAIGSATGAITVNGENKLDYETTPSYSLTVSVSDGDLAGTATVTITVTDIEEMVTFTVTVSVVDTSSGLIAEPISDLVVSQIPENTAYTATPATAGATPIGAVTWALSGDDATAFTIDVTSGIVRMIGRDFEAPVDADNNNVYLATVIATDSAGNVANIDIAITVTNTNEAPAISGTTIFTIAENAGDGAMVGTIIGADVDAGTTLTYSITAGNANDAFTIGSATGAITVNGDNKLDYETTPAYLLTVTVSDSSLEATATVTINVEDVNEAPTITGTPPATIAEDSAYSFTPEGGDIDANDTPSYALSNHPTWLIVNDATGTLSGTPTNTDVGVRSDIVLTITSGDETATLTFSIEVTNTNDTPTISGIPDTTIAQDADYLFAPVGADIDVGDTLEYAITNTPDWATFNEETGALSGTPTNTHVGITEDIVISVSDGIAEAVSLPPFSITVTNTNDAPTITGTPPATIAEDSAYTFMPGGGDVDNPASDFSYAIAGKPTWATFNGATGELSGTPRNADVGTTSNIRISLTSGGQTVSLPDFSIEVTNTNDAPTITGTTTFTIAENASDGAMVGTITGADVDAGTTLTYSITAGNTNDAFTIDSASGDITVHGDSKLDHETTPSYSLMVTVSDSSLEATATVTINVEDVNEAPTITGTPPDMVAEDDACSFTPGGGDVDANDTPVYSLSNHPNWLSVNDATGTLSGTPTNTDVGVRSDIVLTITSGDETATLTFSIEVTNTNDAPKGEITIKGITIVAETLEAITTDIIDDDGLTNVEYSYQWREGETSISDATEKIFLLTEEQVGKTISVKVNYTDDRGANEEMISSQTDIITSTSLGNEDFEIAYFIIYPNPAKDILNITAPEKADYKLLSIRGNIIKKGTFTKGKNYINISSLARGVYLLNIKTDKGNFTEKVVRN